MTASPRASVVVEMYRDGASMSEIADETGASRELVRGLLLGAGLRLRGRWRKRPLPPVAEIAKRYQAGESIHDLEKSYGETWTVIAGILEGAGVPLRGTSDAMRVLHSRRSPEEHEKWARAAREGRDRARRERKQA